jgi:hypothetical protein
VGRPIVLVGVGDEPSSELDVAEQASVEEALKLLVVIEDRSRLRARRFAICSWNEDGPDNTSSTGIARDGEREEA